MTHSHRIVPALRLKSGWVGAWTAAAMCLPVAAHGQAFPAIGTVVQGSAEISTGPRATNVAVFSSEVVINWALDDLVYGTVNFQSPGPNANVPFFAFAGRASSGNVAPYSPLGPIFATGGITNFLPADAVATFSGSGDYTVLNRLLLPGAAAFSGTVQSFVGNNPGGNIWFYSPTGIIIGSSAVFNVGSLVLTTNDIEREGGLFGPGNAIRFRGPASSTAAIAISPGARLNALASDGAYLALVAPRIVQGGALRSNGSTALVAAEQADIRIDAGLLDIVVTQGTSDPNGIVHTGSTGGAVTGDPQAISLVAIPKNDAITMLLAGSIGYAPAAQATTEGTSIVLSSGAAPGGASPQADGSILIGNAVFTSPLSGYASDAIEVAPAAGGITDFRADASLAAGQALSLTAIAGARINAHSALDLVAGAGGPGGTASINAVGGTVSAGELTVDASGFGVGDGDGIGGTIGIAASNGGAIEAEALTAIADGLGGEADRVGGDGIGGSVTIRDAGGRLALGSVTVSANGIGGSGGIGNGDAVGGLTRIEVLSQPQAWDDLTVDASASGPVDADGANSFTGGRIAVATSSGGALSLSGDFSARSAGNTAPAGQGFSLQTSGTGLSIGGEAEIATVGDVQLSLGAGGALETGGGLSITTPRSVTATGLVASGGPVSIIADLGIGMNALRSGGTTLLSAVSGPIAISADLRSVGPVTVLGESVNIASAGSLDFAEVEASAGDVLLSADGDIRAAGVSGEDVTLLAGGDIVADGDLTSSGALQLQAGRLLAVNARATGASISAASGDISIGANGQLGERGTTQSLLLTNTGPTSRTFIGGTAQAGAYSLDAGEAGRLFADQSIAITAPVPDQPSAVPADFVVGAFTMGFGAERNLGAGGTLRVQTAGRVEVGGAVQLTTANGNDTFAIDANRIEIDPSGGSIAMRSAGNALQGRLNLAADTVAAASPSTLALVDAQVTPLTINTLLDMPSATANDQGYLQAGQINVSISDGFFVQNSGANMSFAARRGFSANSLAITTRSADALIVINGRTFDAQGVAVTGLETAQTVLINGRFHPLSSINGCFIGRNCRALPADVIPPHSNIDGPIDIRRNLDLARGVDLAEDLDRVDGFSVLDRNEALSQDGITLDRNGVLMVDDLAIPQEFQTLPYLLSFDRQDPASQRPLLDEPVTGVGNDDLWQGNCGPVGCPAGDSGQPGNPEP